MDSVENNCPRQKFLTFLDGKGLRLTAQRRAIVDAVFATDEHFTADQLIAWSQQRDRTVSRATVYRTLPLLTESGLVQEMDFGKNRKIYDPNYAAHPNHNHIICQDCDKIIEFESDKISRLDDEISQRFGFSVSAQRVQITGTCEELKRSGNCKNKTAPAEDRS